MMKNESAAPVLVAAYTLMFAGEASREPSAMPSSNREAIFKTIFHPADFTESDQGAFEHALKLAVLTGAHLTLLHAGAAPDNIHWSHFPRVRKTLEQWRLLPHGYTSRDFAKLRLRVEKIERAERDPVRATLDYVAENKPDLIVLSTHQRHGISRWLHKAVAEPIARGAHTLTLFVPRNCAGFVSHKTGDLTLKTILIPVDVTPLPQSAIDVAHALPRVLGCPDVQLRIFHAGSSESLVRVNNLVAPGYTIETTCWEGNPVDNICSVSNAQMTDLIVMATAGRHGFLDALRGSTTERLVRESRCPVLAVPNP